MDWREINCIVEALEALIEKYKQRLEGGRLDDDDRSDVSNDLAYAEILLSTYKERRDTAWRG
jgi:hypothetical protein